MTTYNHIVADKLRNYVLQCRRDGRRPAYEIVPMESINPRYFAIRTVNSAIVMLIGSFPSHKAAQNAMWLAIYRNWFSRWRY